MLRAVHPGQAAQCTIGEAAYPVPFPSGLEFNPPVHGTWNIVHTGMQLPQSHQIYVCAANCMRGVVLTAAEMNALDRFSMVILEEQDLMEGTVEDITIEGTAAVLEKLPQLPPVVLLFTVCVHHFLGCDLGRIYDELGRRFPSVTFVRCFMDPIMRKSGLTPDQKLRKSLVEVLPPRPVKQKNVSLLGGDFPLSAECELRELFRANGWTLREMFDCASFREYLTLGESSHLLTVYPQGVPGVSLGAERLGRSFLYLPQCFGYEEIRSHFARLSRELGLPLPDLDPLEARCEEALRETLDLVGETPIVLDGTVHPRPLGLARLLAEHGFSVQRIYLDAVSPEEEADFRWLQENQPGLVLRAVIRPEMRVMVRGCGEKVLALGQKAAWFERTPYFVNLVQGGGLWGFSGIWELCGLMKEAFLTEKDTRDIVPRKGLGCESCI